MALHSLRIASKNPAKLFKAFKGGVTHGRRNVSSSLSPHMKRALVFFFSCTWGRLVEAQIDRKDVERAS